MGLTLTLIILCVCVRRVHAHAKMVDPPGRSTMWRYGFNTPINYNDNQLYCGGYRETVLNDGKCGVCGDPYNGPYENEAGGRYATGTISRRYTTNDTYLNITIQVSAYHMGHFEFKICPHNNYKVKVKQSCLDKHPLRIASEEQTGSYKYYPSKKGEVSLHVEIPHGMVCEQCVLQWKYITGNFWGVSANGTACRGCGPQEQFINCADISIGYGTRSLAQNQLQRIDGDDSDDAHGHGHHVPIRKYVDVEKLPHNLTRTCDRCYALPMWKHYPKMDDWCDENCKLGNCPPCRCYCGCPDIEFVNPCKSTGEKAGTQMESWCWRECCENNCPADKCMCENNIKDTTMSIYNVKKQFFIAGLLYSHNIDHNETMQLLDKLEKYPGTTPKPVTKMHLYLKSRTNNFVIPTTVTKEATTKKFNRGKTSKSNISKYVKGKFKKGRQSSNIDEILLELDKPINHTKSKIKVYIHPHDNHTFVPPTVFPDDMDSVVKAMVSEHVDTQSTKIKYHARNKLTPGGRTVFFPQPNRTLQQGIANNTVSGNAQQQRVVSSKGKRKESAKRDDDNSPTNATESVNQMHVSNKVITPSSKIESTFIDIDALITELDRVSMENKAKNIHNNSNIREENESGFSYLPKPPYPHDISFKQGIYGFSTLPTILNGSTYSDASVSIANNMNIKSIQDGSVLVPYQKNNDIKRDDHISTPSNISQRKNKTHTDNTKLKTSVGPADDMIIGLQSMASMTRNRENNDESSTLRIKGDDSGNTTIRSGQNHSERQIMLMKNDSKSITSRSRTDENERITMTNRKDDNENTTMRHRNDDIESTTIKVIDQNIATYPTLILSNPFLKANSDDLVRDDTKSVEETAHHTKRVSTHDLNDADFKNEKVHFERKDHDSNTVLLSDQDAYDFLDLPPPPPPPSSDEVDDTILTKTLDSKDELTITKSWNNKEMVNFPLNRTNENEEHIINVEKIQKNDDDEKVPALLSLTTTPLTADNLNHPAGLSSQTTDSVKIFFDPQDRKSEELLKQRRLISGSTGIENPWLKNSLNLFKEEIGMIEENMMEWERDRLILMKNADRNAHESKPSLLGKDKKSFRKPLKDHKNVRSNSKQNISVATVAASESEIHRGVIEPGVDIDVLTSKEKNENQPRKDIQREIAQNKDISNTEGKHDLDSIQLDNMEKLTTSNKMTKVENLAKKDTLQESSNRLSTIQINTTTPSPAVTPTTATSLLSLLLANRLDEITQQSVTETPKPRIETTTLRSNTINKIPKSLTLNYVLQFTKKIDILKTTTMKPSTTSQHTLQTILEADNERVVKSLADLLEHTENSLGDEKKSLATSLEDILQGNIKPETKSGEEPKTDDQETEKSLAELIEESQNLEEKANLKNRMALKRFHDSGLQIFKTLFVAPRIKKADIESGKATLPPDTPPNTVVLDINLMNDILELFKRFVGSMHIIVVE